MNNTLKTIASLCFIALFSACQKDDTTDNTDIRTDFIGSWKCVQTSKITGASEFTVTITKDTGNDSRINLENFYKLGAYSVYANISTVVAEALEIPVQTVQSNIIKGSGTQINDTKINFEYTVDDGNETDTLTAVFTKL